MDGNEQTKFYQYKKLIFCEKGCKIYANRTSEELNKNWKGLFLSSIYKFAILAMFCKFNNKFALFCEQMR